MLPLVPEDHRAGYPGWCVYDFRLEPDARPEIEVFCGGNNSKQAGAAGIWRQGHLLHWGFQPTPGEMNETGRSLLVNAITYIARFKEDRPIVQASARAQPRSSLARWLADGKVEWIKAYIADETWKGITAADRDGLTKWFAANGDYLYFEDDKLAVDEDAKALGVAVNTPAFFAHAITSCDDSRLRAAALRALSRFAPDGPAGSPSDWAAWFGTNRAYLFFSECGGYRWYVDPLARKRGVPTRELRGPKRATPAR